MWRVHCAYYPAHLWLTGRLMKDLCLNVQLVIGRSLASLPRRRTDNAIIMRTQENSTGKATVFKLNASTSDHSILLKRWVFSGRLWNGGVSDSKYVERAGVSGNSGSRVQDVRCQLDIRRHHHPSSRRRISTSFPVLSLNFKVKFHRMHLMVKMMYNSLAMILDND